MIVTVTMNPAIDKTIEINSLVHGGLNRIQRVEYDVGGKGINVSKTIRELGETSIATGFLGGNNGRTIACTLKEMGILEDFVRIQGETRTNTKVYEKNGILTELNEPGPVPTKENILGLMEKLDHYAGEQTLFVLSGSIPAGVDRDIYARIIRRVRDKGAKVLLDADGELFRNALEAKPDMIKPNHVELAEYAKLNHPVSDEELLAAAEKLTKEGIDRIAVSMGKDGAMFLLEDYRVRCQGLSVSAHSTVGAGDAMVAALAYAWEHKMEPEETVRLCMAVSAGAVTTVGTKPPARELVEQLKAEVRIERIG